MQRASSYEHPGGARPNRRTPTELLIRSLKRPKVPAQRTYSNHAVFPVGDKLGVRTLKLPAWSGGPPRQGWRRGPAVIRSWCVLSKRLLYQKIFSRSGSLPGVSRI
jgi:hypothetical protein